MPGPEPKPAGQRRRRNASVGPARLPAAGSRKRPPVLPLSKDVLASTREWWRTVWRSPMATVWLPADVPGLVRLAGLVDRAARGPAPVALLVEIRNLEDRYGLNPLARRRLQWEIEQPTPGAESNAHRTEDAERWRRVTESV